MWYSVGLPARVEPQRDGLHVSVHARHPDVGRHLGEGDGITPRSRRGLAEHGDDRIVALRGSQITRVHALFGANARVCARLEQELHHGGVALE